jgi:hypothetical protein
VTVLERNAWRAANRLRTEVHACIKAGNRLAAIRNVRRYLRDCGEPNGYNDAVAWGRMRGINLGPKNVDKG